MHLLCDANWHPPRPQGLNTQLTAKTASLSKASIPNQFCFPFTPQNQLIPTTCSLLCCNLPLVSASAKQTAESDPGPILHSIPLK